MTNRSSAAFFQPLHLSLKMAGARLKGVKWVLPAMGPRRYPAPPALKLEFLAQPAVMALEGGAAAKFALAVLKRRPARMALLLEMAAPQAQGALGRQPARMASEEAAAGTAAREALQMEFVARLATKKIFSAPMPLASPAALRMEGGEFLFSLQTEGLQLPFQAMARRHRQEWAHLSRKTPAGADYRVRNLRPQRVLTRQALSSPEAIAEGCFPHRQPKSAPGRRQTCGDRSASAVPA